MALADFVLTNVLTDRAMNVDAFTMDELADVLGTLIADLQAVAPTVSTPISTHTVEDVARRVMALANAGDNYILASGFVNERYRQFLRRARPRTLRKVAEMNTVASIDTGTVTATRGSTAITADAAAQAVLSSAVAGRFIRLKTAWYEISSYTAPTIALSKYYSEADATANTYTIVQRYYSLPAGVRHFGCIVHPRQRVPLVAVPLDLLDEEYPERTLVSDLISYVAEVGTDNSGARKIEIYPPTENIELLRYVYWEDPGDLTPTSNLPPFLDVDILTTGVLADILRHKAAVSADAGKEASAQLYLNWASREETLFQQKMVEASRALRAVSDTTAVLRGFGSGSGVSISGGDIKTARDYVYSRWTPLT
jgi:hypothetical protein